MENDYERFILKLASKIDKIIGVSIIAGVVEGANWGKLNPHGGLPSKTEVGEIVGKVKNSLEKIITEEVVKGLKEEVVLKDKNGKEVVALQGLMGFPVKLNLN